MGNLNHLICFALLSVVSPAHARELTFEERVEVDRLEKQIEDLEKRYDLYSKKLQAVKKRTDDLDARVNYVPSMVQGRLTAQSGVPVSFRDTVDNATIYFTPYKGNYITVYYKNQWRIMRFSEISLTLSGTTTDTNYDVFVYRASLGVLALELSAAWTDNRTRSEALTQVDGVYVKASDTTRRYLGTVRTNATGDRYDDGTSTRGLWNYYNRVKRTMRRYDSTNTWTYNSATWRQAGGDVDNDANFVIGINEVLVMVKVKTNLVSNNTTARLFTTGVGVNTLTVNSAQLMGGRCNTDLGPAQVNMSVYYGYPGIGLNVLSYIESNAAGAGNARSSGDNGSAQTTRSGILAIIEG